mgnify:CR=1 FL=1
MCGIGGVFSVSQERRVDPQLLVNMAAIQAHRGPDGFGIESIEGLGVGFCHARLSIIDLNEARGRQPWARAQAPGVGRGPCERPVSYICMHILFLELLNEIYWNHSPSNKNSAGINESQKCRFIFNDLKVRKLFF